MSMRCFLPSTRPLCLPESPPIPSEADLGRIYRPCINFVRSAKRAVSHEPFSAARIVVMSASLATFLLCLSRTWSYMSVWGDESRGIRGSMSTSRTSTSL